MRKTSILSIAAAVLLGIIPAFVLVFGFGKIFATVIAPTIVSQPKTPLDPIVIDFSRPMEGEYRGEVSLFPEASISKQWSSGGRQLILSPTQGWNPGERYELRVGEDRKTIGTSVPSSFFSFSLPEYPVVVTTIPQEGAHDVFLGVEDPISVLFDRSVKDFFVDFRISPGVEVVYENNPEKTEFHILPKEPVLPGTSYTLEIYAKWRGMPDSTYRFLGKTFFTTLPDRPKEWSRDLDIRLDEAKRYAHPIVSQGKYIDINLESQIMTLFEDGRLIDAYLVSSGKRGMDTPKGEYAIQNKADRPWSKKYALYMPYWMALTADGKYGIHELPEWPGGYKEGANHLGLPVSHGCVRLGIGPAKNTYEWAEIGTKVVIH